jgi:hypothetical protein
MAKSKVKNPHGGDMDYAVKKLEVMTPEKKARAEAIAKGQKKDASKKKAGKK